MPSYILHKEIALSLYPGFLLKMLSFTPNQMIHLLSSQSYVVKQEKPMLVITVQTACSYP